MRKRAKLLCLIITMSLILSSLGIVPVAAADSVSPLQAAIIEAMSLNGDERAAFAALLLSTTQGNKADTKTKIEETYLKTMTTGDIGSAVDNFLEYGETTRDLFCTAIKAGLPDLSGSTGGFDSIRSIINAEVTGDASNDSGLKFMVKILEVVKILDGNVASNDGYKIKLSFDDGSHSALIEKFNELIASVGSLPGNSISELLTHYEGQVNLKSNTEIFYFKNFLKSNKLFDSVIPDPRPKDKDDGGGSGSSGGGGSTTTPTTPTIEPVVKANPDGTTNIALDKPVLDNTTKQATTAINTTTLDKALEQAKPDAEGVKTVEIQVPAVTGANAYSVGLPAKALTSDTQANQVFNIITEIATVTVANDMFTKKEVEDASKVELVVAKANVEALTSELKAQIGDRPLIEINLKVDGKVKEFNNPNSPVTFSLNYTPTAEELKNPDKIVVWYIDSNGKAIEVPNGRYDAKTGKVTFSTTHFSLYAISYVDRTFVDIDKYLWAKIEIESMTAKGILKSTSTDKFSPEQNITRGDFLYGLVRALNLSAKVDSNFDDVSKTDYYWNEIAIAKKLDITNGIGNNKFDPNASITRQDMMALTARALKKLNKITASPAELKQFEDNEKISDYAKESIALMVAEGFIKGDGKNINPKNNTSRAEGAAVVYRIYKK